VFKNKLKVHDMKRRVVITGMGMLTPVGNNTEETFQSIVNGKSGVGYITYFDASDSPVKIAAELKNFNKEEYVDKKEAKLYDNFIIYALAAAEMAKRDANLEVSNITPERAGIIVGSIIGGVGTIESNYDIYLKKGMRRISPFYIPSACINMANGLISIKYKLKGPSFSIVSACATGAHSVGEAFKIIQRNDADLMFAGGSEACITPTTIGGFVNMRALSKRNDDPTKASRPFDKDRDGFIMGEGCGIIILEELEHAKARGAKIYAEIVGFGLTSDAYHITAPDSNGDGAKRCMEMAIKDAGIQPDMVDYINAHGTSTPYNDVLETKAIKNVFGKHAYNLHISSTKSTTGHLVGAAGSVETGVCALSLYHGIIPPTINLDECDPECDLNYTPNKAVQKDIKYALNNSFGFGGTNACLLLKKYE
jgi:3-oxoacyl-[acyl-carrier-protein] synthase II